ncbi:unnamed protein product [Parnassius apollo]|uniref:(apollo) hypothetical protein n=1 Tax=Parnassius apollo TaxID=110799 RepID=A0A8S3Y3Z5_PARAO|nr:unnamed protein product [Parnassius apollo]
MRSLEVILILFIFYVETSVAFKKGEEGVCLVPIRKQVRGRGKTPVKPTYKLVCCDGWMYDVATQKCVFHCRFGCERGKCVGPNKCSCDPPLILENNKCVDPVCDPPCVNGKCGGNNICLCDPGYEKVNTTHCAPVCLPGYEHPCFNGSCKATNNMTAWDTDAVNSDLFTCIPKCAQDCINGACVAPDVCKCHEGYTNESQWQCSPVCDYCENGTCVAPNECQCFDGYSKKDGKTCTPDCETPCEHGVCTAPDVCTCDSGYELQYTITNNNITQETCQPVCSEVCINGHCESPDTCACDPGFIRKDIHPSICYKLCPGLCENGVCTLSGKCDCQRGYVLENETCIAMTPVNCETCGGNCTTEDICWCSNDRPCFFPAEVESAEIASSTMLAGLGLTWMVGGAVGLLLLILVIVVIGQMWRKRKEYPTNEGNNFSSVAYTVPNTLLKVREDIKPENDYDVVDDQDPTKAAGEALLEETTVIDDKMYD